MVDVRADGSAHVNVAGSHVEYPTGDETETRTAVIAYAADLARSMNRPVRMTTSGQDSTWKLAVHPNGTVTDLAAENAKPTRRPRTVLEQPSAAATRPSSTIDRTPASSLSTPAPVVERSDVGEAAPLEQGPSGAAVPIATLTSSTGVVARIRAATLLGCRPTAQGGKNTDELLTVDDGTCTISKTHARLEWRDGELWITDRHSANGTIAARPGQNSMNLTAGQPYQLIDGDVLRLGDTTFTVNMGEVNP